MDDNTARAAASAFGTSMFSLLLAYCKAKLRARRDKIGCGLPEEIGRWLGKRWARACRAYKSALQR
jgi:hypothetical protein